MPIKYGVQVGVADPVGDAMKALDKDCFKSGPLNEKGISLMNKGGIATKSRNGVLFSLDMNMTDKGRNHIMEAGVSDFPYIGKQGAVQVMQKLAPHATCKIVDLSGNRITGQKAAKAIQKVLKENKVLQELHLANNNFQPKDVAVIVEGLVHNETLKVLNLSGNSLCDTSAKIIAQGLLENSSLEGLLLNNNNIRDEGAKELAKLLDPSIDLQLKTLSVCFNDIRCAGAKRICRFLTGNGHLEFLGIAGNKIKGADYVSQLMLSRKDQGGKVLQISLDHNRFSAEDVVLLNKLAVESRVQFVRTNFLIEKGNVTKSVDQRMHGFYIKAKRNYKKTLKGSTARLVK